MTAAASFEVVCDDSDVERWRDARRVGVGASEVATILGVNPWDSAFALWARKTGRAPDVEESGKMRRGKLAEPAIIADYVAETGREVRRWGQLLRFRALPCLLATPDAERTDDGAVVELKFTGQDWSDIPLYYQLQQTTQMGVAGRARGALVAWCGNDLWHRELDFHAGAFDAILSAVERFWWHVENDVAPETDGSQATTEALKRIAPNPGLIVNLPSEAAVWDAELVRIKDALKGLEEEKRRLENQIKAALGEAEKGILPNGGAYTFKSKTMPERVLAATTYRELRRVKG